MADSDNRILDADATTYAWGLTEAEWLSRVQSASARADAAEERVGVLEAAVRKYHEWLEQVDQHPGYMGLDHAVGENVEGCTGCALLAVPEGDAQ